MIVGIDSSTTRNEYKHHGVGVYTANMIEWLPRVGKDMKVETDLSKPFDIFLQPNFYDGFPKDLKCPKVVMIHDLTLLKFNYYSARGPLVNFAKGLLYRYKLQMVHEADGILVNSENTKRDVMELPGIPEGKIKVAYLGLKNIGQDKPARNIGQPEKYLLYVGGAEFNKNLQRLVRAFSEVRGGKWEVGKGHPRHLESDVTSGEGSPRDRRGFFVAGAPQNDGDSIKLVLIGKQFVKEGKKEAEILKKEIRRLGLEDQIICPGFVPDKDLGSWYKKALAFVYPSFYEGFGFPILEAMARGCPVVTSGASSLPEVGGDAVLYFDPYDVNDIAEKLRQVISNESIRGELSKKGPKQAKKFTWRNCAEETVDFLRHFL